MARLWLIHVFCKILDIYLVSIEFWAKKNPVSVYVMRKSCNKTHFCMIYTFFSKFSQVSSSFVMKILLELELIVF